MPKKLKTGKRGQPRIVLTEEEVGQVRRLGGMLDVQQMAYFLGISKRTLERRFQDQPEAAEAYRRGRANTVSVVATSLVNQARAGNVVAAIFYLKTQAGWRERDQVEVSGPEGGPIPIEALRALAGSATAEDERYAEDEEIELLDDHVPPAVAARRNGLKRRATRARAGKLTRPKKR